MNNEIKVFRGAPNWPAQVRKTSKEDFFRAKKDSAMARKLSSSWLESKYSKNLSAAAEDNSANASNDREIKSTNCKSVPSTGTDLPGVKDNVVSPNGAHSVSLTHLRSIVRQCTSCKILYQYSHICTTIVSTHTTGRTERTEKWAIKCTK